MSSAENAKMARSWITIFIMLTVCNAFSFIPSMAYVPLIPAIKNAIAMNFTQLGLFSGMAGVIAIVVSIPAGMLIKRFGEKKVYIGGTALIVIGLVILAISKDFVTALTGRGIWQIGLRCVVPAITAAIVISVPDNRRGTILGINSAVGMIGTVLAMNISASMSQTLGWRASILFFCGLVVIGGIILSLFYKRRPAIDGKPETNKNASIDLHKTRSIYAMPSFWLLCLLVLFACEEGLVDNFAVLQMKEVWATGAVQFSKIVSIGMMLAVIVNLIAGWSGDKFGQWNMLILAGILNTCVGLCLIIGGMYGSMSIYIVGILIAKALQLTVILLVNSMAAMFNEGNVGPVIAIIAFGSGLGQYIGPQVLGILRDVTKAYTAGWVYMAMCGAISLFIAIGFKMYYQKNAKTLSA